ncbi:MAG: hypothetical protein JXB42_04275 [Deltaproteobacteria bacterium]|nr:hypothetical protein [Deltaproteobacteria bacterium]
METKKVYHCEICGEEIDLKLRKQHEAECRVKTAEALEGLEPCLKTDTAEHSRGGDEDDACYDGREGKI